MHVAAGIAILLTAGLIIFFDRVPTPLNRNIAMTSARERLPGTLIHGTIGFALGTCCLLGLWPAYWLAALWYAVVLVAAIRNWWVPYIAGTYPGEISAETYAKEYARNLTVLPRRTDRPVTPDVQHSLIHLFVLLSSLISLLAALGV